MYYSRVHTERPAYADLDAPEKFQAILGIIGTRLRQHPRAICSYSGGSDSDILIDLIETARKLFNMPEDLEKIRPYEPNVVKAAWNIFGDSYRYRQEYNAYKAKKQAKTADRERNNKNEDIK